VKVKKNIYEVAFMRLSIKKVIADGCNIRFCQSIRGTHAISVKEL